jgi:signal transduction histidine kinase
MCVGTGLWLVLAKEIVELHGGKIVIDNELALLSISRCHI